MHCRFSVWMLSVFSAFYFNLFQSSETKQDVLVKLKPKKKNCLKGAFIVYDFGVLWEAGR
jgi:hypothetical protein